MLKPEGECPLPGPSTRLRIGIAVSTGGGLCWMEWLAEALTSRHEITFVAVPGTHTGAIPASVGWILQLERMIYRTAQPCSIDGSELVNFHVVPLGQLKGDFDALIDCTGGQATIVPAGRRLTVTFGGIPSEIGALSALFDGQDVELAIWDGQSSRAIAAALPAISDRRIIGGSMDQICSIAIELISVALEHSTNGVDEPRRAKIQDQMGTFNWPGVGHFANGVGYKAVRWLTAQLVGPERWFVGWRYAPKEPLMAAGSARYTRILDDGQRFFADPFPFTWKGETYIFFEEFPFSTQRGRVSLVKIGENGVVSSPRARTGGSASSLLPSSVLVQWRNMDAARKRCKLDGNPL